MFRRRWSGLPAVPEFIPDLKKLEFVTVQKVIISRTNQADISRAHSYFINEDDEIRNVHDPDFYFKYFLTKNQTYNDCQRFAFNGT